MLAKPHRITKPDDFRRVIRHGKKQSSKNFTTHSLKRSGELARFGIIVTKSSGSSPDRNLLRRRIREICRMMINSGLQNQDIVIRALPSKDMPSFTEIYSEIESVISLYKQENPGSNIGSKSVIS